MREAVRSKLSLTEALLARHGLTVPHDTAELIAKRIFKCRVVARQPKAIKGEKLSPKQRLRNARKHAEKLLHYADHPPSRKDSISTRSKSLAKALNDPHVVISLAAPNLTRARSINVPLLLTRLDTRKLNKTELARLVKTLRSVETEAPKRSGRPVVKRTLVIRTACLAWWRAGKTSVYTWNEAQGRLDGGLPDFIRDLMTDCGLKVIADSRLQVELARTLQFLRRTMRATKKPD